MDPVSRAQSSPENKKKTGRWKKGQSGNPAKQFKPGESGNPGGRPKKRPITEIFEELFGEKKDREAIKKQVRRTMTKRGMAGVLLLREAAERLEGKVAQEVNVEGTIKVTLEQVLEAKKKAGK